VVPVPLVMVSAPVLLVMARVPPLSEVVWRLAQVKGQGWHS
jgi:hypothetical protein